jgi:hypothetical protein
MKTCLAVLLLASALSAFSLAAQTTNNDSSCDIGVTPAATLLLPYFEVDFRAPPAEALTTLFTITNTSRYAQIARATIWTDWGYPVLTFDLFLTGYDVSAINLYDVIANGRLPTRNVPAPGVLSAPNWANPNHGATIVPDCASRPDSIGPALLSDLQLALTNGRPSGPAACPSPNNTPARIGSNHGINALGYVTIDVVATCSAAAPGDPRYFASDLLYDNVLIGDWMSVAPGKLIGNYAMGSPLVHIRAIPEGGPAGTAVPPVLPYTFYGGYRSATTPPGIDRRQPLPSVFSVRYIQGGGTDFQTRLTMWRERVTGPGASCASYSENSNLPLSEVIRFDEHENSMVVGSSIRIPEPLPGDPGVPLSSTLHTFSSTFPYLTSPQGDIAGWLYLNLGRYSNSYGRTIPGVGQQQAWLVVTMYAEGRYAQAFDAAALSNGCSPPPAVGARIGGQ